MKISLKAARVNANLTQKEVAERMNISKNTLVNWEKGRTMIDDTPLMVLSEIYSVDIENLFLG